MSYFKIALIASLGLIGNTHAIGLAKDDAPKEATNEAPKEATDEAAKPAKTPAPTVEKSETNFHNPNKCCPCPGVLKVVTSTDWSSLAQNYWRQNTQAFENNCCKCEEVDGVQGSE